MNFFLKSSNDSVKTNDNDDTKSQMIEVFSKEISFSNLVKYHASMSSFNVSVKAAIDPNVIDATRTSDNITNKVMYKIFLIFTFFFFMFIPPIITR